MDQRQTIIDRLEEFGQEPDGAIDLAEAALLLGALDRPETDLQRYRRHLADLVRDVGEGARELKTPQAQARHLSNVLSDAYGYDGNQHHFDDPMNANLLSVIDSRRGLPVTLGILYIHAGAAQGWAVNGLNFPGYFLVCVGEGEDMAVIDPFQNGRILSETDIQGFLQRLKGAQSGTVHPRDLGFMGNRAILVRLLSNIKQRASQMKDETRALEIAERLVMIAPTQPNVLYDSAVMNAQVGHLSLALQNLATAAENTQDAAFRKKVMSTLDTVKRQLN